MATLYAKNEYYMNGDENEQFSGTEKYVFEKIKSKKIHWFPLNKYLSKIIFQEPSLSLKIYIYINNINIYKLFFINLYYNFKKNKNK